MPPLRGGGTSTTPFLVYLVALCAFSHPSIAQDRSLEGEVEQYLLATEKTADGGQRMEAHWDKGLHFRTPDGSFEFDLNGLFLFDLAWRGSSDFDAADTPNETGVRAARLGFFGHAYHNFLYKLQVDFANSDSQLKDAYMGLRNLGAGLKLLAGHFKEPFGLEALTSRANTLFMERSAATDAFAPGFNAGLLLTNNESFHLAERVLPAKLVGRTRVTGAVGVFQTTDSSVSATDGDASITARLAWMIDVNQERHALLHGAIAYSYRGDDTVRYNDRSGFADTGSMSVSSSQLLALEFTAIAGGFTVAVEYFYTSERQETGPNTNFHGGYAKIGYWITGEEQGWRLDRYIATIPDKNLLDEDGGGGTGGFWIGYRFGALDLNDGDIRGGEQYVHTVGGIWRWNANARVMLNLVLQDVRDGPNGSGDIHQLTLRFQFNF
ncbi:MAG: porin [Planctomycetota bacterium]